MPRAARGATRTETGDDLVDAAQHALDLVGEDPHRALERADTVLARLSRPASRDELRAYVTAQRAAARALRNLGDTSEALSRARLAVLTADKRGFPELAAEGRMTLSFMLLEVGQVRSALSTIDRALGSLDGLEAARARTNRALILHRADRPREAMAEFSAALPVIRRAGDGWSERAVRNNRAALYAEQGQTAAAVADLEWSRAYALQQGSTIDAADDLWNLAMVHSLAGDYPRALALYDQADKEWGNDVDRPQRFTARAETLLDVGLTTEAALLAREGIAWAQTRGWRYAEAEARLWLALASLISPSAELGEAAEQSRVAIRDFGRQGRPDWQVLARYVDLLVRLRQRVRPSGLDRAVEVASLLRDRGRDAHAADLRVRAGRAALVQGDIARARTLLGPLANQTTSRQLEVRSRAWFARALLQMHDGDPAVGSSLLKAWRTNDEQVALRGATELRAVAASHGNDIVVTASAWAVKRSNPKLCFDWAERARAASLRRPFAMAPADQDLAEALARLRWSAMLDEAALQSGQPDAAARTRRRRDEAEVLRVSRRAVGSEQPTDLAQVPALRQALDDRTLVEYLSDGHDLWAVKVHRRGSALVKVGDVRVISEHVDTVNFTLRRLLASPRGRATESLTSMLLNVAERLRELLLDPLGLPPEADLVISPAGPLCRLPWGALEMPYQAPSIAPSATTWLQAAARSRVMIGHQRPLVVAGPGLPGAESEARAVAKHYARADLMIGEDAGVDRVLAKLPEASAVHFATHGDLRRDNPQFSALLLGDGPLTAYHLELLPRIPVDVVLSACSAGAAPALAGDEVLGLAWTLIAHGACAVLAPLMPVPDGPTASLMTSLHAGLAQGHSMLRAWRTTMRQASNDDELRPIVMAFTLYGG